MTDLYKHCSGMWNVLLSDGILALQNILSHLVEGELKGHWVSYPHLTRSKIIKRSNDEQI